MLLKFLLGLRLTFESTTHTHTHTHTLMTMTGRWTQKGSRTLAESRICAPDRDANARWMEICPLAGAADLPIEASLTKQHLTICKMLLHL